VGKKNLLKVGPLDISKKEEISDLMGEEEDITL
jgi:hypothetical protein